MVDGYLYRELEVHQELDYKGLIDNGGALGSEEYPSLPMDKMSMGY